MTDLTITPPDEPDGDFERTRWTASGEAWDRWADPLAEMAAKLNEPLLTAAAVGPGDRILDLASGAGEPALGAARRAGPTGFVLGLDLVPAMLAGAVRRAASASSPAPSFIVADMARLPLEEGGFDGVTCRFGIMFCPDVAAALAECRRVLRPGGRAAFMVWGPRDDNTLFRELTAALDEALGPGSDDMAPLFRFAAEGSLARVMRQAGFVDIQETSVTPAAHVPVERPFWRANLEMSAAPRLAPLDEQGRQAVEAAVRRRFEAIALEGICPLSLHARIVAGCVPSG